MITWVSTKSPTGMLDTFIPQDIKDYLRANRGVDPAMLAADLGLCQRNVEAWQRLLGLRKCVPPGRKKNTT